MSNVVGYKLDFVEFTCELCGAVALGKSPKRKYCDDCRYRRHLNACEEYRQREQVADRDSWAAVVPTVEKPKYTLSEVSEAARKNRMSYGNYVYQWSIGKVEPPEKFPEKKKRGRKKRER